MTSLARKCTKVIGYIRAVSDCAVKASIPRASVGDICWLVNRAKKRTPALVTSFTENVFTLAPFEDASGLYPGALVETFADTPKIPVGEHLVSRVVNALGMPIDGKPIQGTWEYRSILQPPPQATSRPISSEPLATGITALDAFCSLAVGQRLGLFASAGVGKSTLLGMVASRADVDVIVVALVGERGREVNEFVQHILGPDGLTKSVVVVATSDESSVMRQTAPYTATTIAEHFRDQGKRVLLVIDSLTRFARAIRETGLAAGELPVRQGYTTSVYTMLPKLLERAGMNTYGSITGLYTILTNEQGDIDPLADEVKSLIDGHIVLSSELYALGIVPAIDVSSSISRMFDRLHDDSYLNAARIVKRALTRLLKERDLLLLGGIPDDEMKRILAFESELLDLIRQPRNTVRSTAETRMLVLSLAHQLRVRG